MRFLPLLFAACAVLAAQPTRAVNIDFLGGEAGVVVGSEGPFSHLRFLQTDNSTTPTPTTATPTPTTATPTPTTATPTPTTATPTPTTATPTPTTETPTEAPTETPEATTETPTATTATPESTTETPTTTTATPDSTTATPTTTPTTEAPTSTTGSSSASASTDGQTGSSAASSSASTGGSDSGSSMSTGAVIGIVVGIIAGVAIIAFLIMFVLRRRRDNDEDPLSPFELSMDKGYSATPGFASQDTYNPRGNAASAAALAARDNQLETGSLSANTPGTAQAAAAGIAYSQFYDQQTSPEHANNGHQYQAQYTTQSSNDSYAQETTHPSNGTNLWMSAMEPKENDTYLSAQSADDKSEQSSRNSYDRGHTGDNDASSEISGASDLNSGKDFPDYEDQRSSRGSYEL